jgi:hypothetical protein
LRAISLAAGVHSTTMALMAAHGKKDAGQLNLFINEGAGSAAY